MSKFDDKAHLQNLPLKKWTKDCSNSDNFERGRELTQFGWVTRSLKIMAQIKVSQPVFHTL